MKLPLLLLASSALWAHDLYLMPQSFFTNPGASILLSAHTGDSFPQSEQPVDPARLVGAQSLPELSWRILGKATHATTTLAAPGSYLFGVSTKPRLLTLEAAKFESYLREEGLNAPLEYRKSHAEAATPGREQYSKFAKTYVVAGQPNARYAQPLGLTIEFVPLQDPSLLSPGDSLPLQVLYRGQPLADVQVELAYAATPMAKGQHRILGRTDHEGKIQATIPGTGQVRLHCVQMERVQEPTHDWESFWASFTFGVRAKSTDSAVTSSAR